MSSLNAPRIVLLLAVLLVATGCPPPTQTYERIAEQCSNPDPATGPAYPTSSRIELSQSCRDAIESYLPYDGAMMAAERESYRRMITEAFYILWAYPLRYPPELRVFGKSPDSFPNALRDFKDVPEDEISFYVFDQVVRILDKITYSESLVDAVAAMDVGLVNGKLILTPLMANYSIWGQAAILVHEAAHQFLGSGPADHVDCTYNGRATQCDYTLNSAYGLESGYIDLLIHGSWRLLADYELTSLGVYSCSNLKHILDLPAELKNWVATVYCARSTFPAATVLALERVSGATSGVIAALRAKQQATPQDTVDLVDTVKK